MDQNNSRRTFVLGLTAILSQATLSACLERKHPKIGFMLDDMGVERWARDRDYFVAAARKLGAEVIVKWGNRDATNQVKQFLSLVENGADVIVVLPINGEVLFKEAVGKAKAAGIKVIAYDRMIFASDIDAYVSVDSEQVGHLQIDTILKAVPKGNYFLLGGDESDGNTRMTRQVHLATLQPHVDRGDIKIVGMEWVDKWEPSIAGDIINRAFEQKIVIDAIVASNDGTAGGVIDVLRGRNLTGKIAVSGQDCDLEACQRIVKGEQTMSVYKHLKDLAALAAETAVAMAKDSEQHFDKQLDNSFKKVNAKLLQPVLITKNNIELLVADGVYTRTQLGI